MGTHWRRFYCVPTFYVLSKNKKISQFFRLSYFNNRYINLKKRGVMQRKDTNGIANSDGFDQAASFGKIIEPCHEETIILHMRKQRRRSASQLPRN